MSQPAILVVDDDEAMLTLQGRVLEKAGWHVTLVTKGADALAAIKAGLDPDLVIVDLHLPGIPGDEFVRRIRRQRPDQRVLYVSGDISRLMRISATDHRAEIVLDKPFTNDALLAAVNRLMAEAPPPGAAPAPTNDGTLTEVLIVDDLEGNRELMRRLLPARDFKVTTVATAAEALTEIRTTPPDVVLCDIRLPDREGFSVCRELKSSNEIPYLPVVLITANYEAKDRLNAIEAGADEFLTKPVNPVELRARLRALGHVKRMIMRDFDRAEHAIVSMALEVEARDPCTAGHCERVAKYATAIGKALSLDREELRTLRRGAFLHDLGKIVVPEAILNKPGPLTPEEMERVKAHAAVGDRLCADVRTLARVRQVVRHHHERADGSGYPDGLRGDAIPRTAEIVGLADAFDALTTTRPFREAFGVDRAGDILRGEVARGWRRRELVDLLLEIVASGRLE